MKYFKYRHLSPPCGGTRHIGDCPQDMRLARAAKYHRQEGEMGRTLSYLPNVHWPAAGSQHGASGNQENTQPPNLY